MLEPTATEVVERITTITLTVQIKTFNRAIPHDQAAAYLRQYVNESADSELFGDIREVHTEERLVDQNDIDNAEAPPCLACGRLFPCDCTDAELADHIEAVTLTRWRGLMGF
jgi:hypothetical protein